MPGSMGKPARSVFWLDPVIEATTVVGQLPGCFGRLVEGDGAGPPDTGRPPIPRPRLACAMGPASRLRFGPTGLSASLCSRASAIALAVASILRSGRWLGGLRFEIAVDSRGERGKASLLQ